MNNAPSVHDDVTRSPEDWTLLLSASTRFKMEKVRNRAIRELASFTLDPVDQIVLAVQHDVPAWLKPAYVVLCQREDPIREEEAERLGLSMMVKLARAREMIRESPQVPTPRIQTLQLEPVPCFDYDDRYYSKPPPVARGRLDTVNVQRVVTEVFFPPPEITSNVSIPLPEDPDVDKDRELVKGPKGKSKKSKR